VLQHTGDRLRLAYVRLGARGAFLDLDRKRNQADVVSLALVFPIRRNIAHLSDIAAVHVRKREYWDGHASYGVVLRLQHGDDIKFGCRSREQAAKTVKLINVFLNLGHG
jgi:hypothetical protein